MKTLKSIPARKLKTIDLSGKTILPGINDSHIQGPFLGANRSTIALDLAAILQKKVQEFSQGKWIRGFGGDKENIEEYKNGPTSYPSKEELDSLSSDNRLVFNEFSDHNMLINSKAMEITGITKQLLQHMKQSGTIL